MSKPSSDGSGMTKQELDDFIDMAIASWGGPLAKCKSCDKFLFDCEHDNNVCPDCGSVLTRETINV